MARYTTWANGFGVGTQDRDDDGDTLLNLGEYALGGNPTNSLDVGMQPTISMVGTNLYYTYAQRADDPTLIYQVQTRQDLLGAGWVNGGFTVVGTNVTGGTFNFVTNSLPLTNQSFVRLMIDQ